MRGVVLGAVMALALVGVGTFWWQGRAAVENGAPPPEPMPLAVSHDAAPLLPEAEAADLVGPAPPEASELNREQRRFFRYDRNRDWRISRAEMLSTRTEAFKKLDKDGNNLLTFEEWAVTTVERFDAADANKDRELSPGEFATTRPKRTKARSCKC